MQNLKDILSTILRQAGETVHEANRSNLGFSSHRSHRPHQLHSPSAFWSDVGRFAFVVWAKGKGGEEEALWGSLEWRVSGAKREGHSVDHPPAGGRDCPRTQQVRVYRFL